MGLTHCLPKLRLISLSPPMKRRDSRSAGYTGGPVNIQAVSFLGDIGEKSIFQVRHIYGEKSEKSPFTVDGGGGSNPRPPQKKPMVPPTTPFVELLGGDNRVSPAGLPILLSRSSTSTHFLSLHRDVASLVSTRDPDDN